MICWEVWTCRILHPGAVRGSRITKPVISRALAKFLAYRISHVFILSCSFALHYSAQLYSYTPRAQDVSLRITYLKMKQKLIFGVNNARQTYAILDKIQIFTQRNEKKIFRWVNRLKEVNKNERLNSYALISIGISEEVKLFSNSSMITNLTDSFTLVVYRFARLLNWNPLRGTNDINCKKHFLHNDHMKHPTK